jgi:MFS family permease
MGLVWGHLSDKYNRKWPLIICCFLFTFFSVVISFCNTYWQVLLARIAFAVFMSSNVPISVSLICDYVQPSERGRAQSLYAAGLYMGVGLSSLAELLDKAVGWRASIRYIGLVCAGFGSLQFFLTEPKRNESSK